MASPASWSTARWGEATWPRVGVKSDLLTLPAFADPHVHLDKALTSDLVLNPRGDLVGAIEAWLAFRNTQSASEIRSRARQAGLSLLANGVTAIRAHVDTGSDIGLSAVEAVLDVRRELVGVLDIQIVACAALPLTGAASADSLALAAEALSLGADLLGGAPYLDEHPESAYDAIIRVALDAGTGLDLHVDETLRPEVFTLPALLDRLEGGFPHAVAVDHIVSLIAQPPEVRRRVAERLAAARVSVVTLPATNLFLQGRGDGTPVARGITAIRELLDAGVTVAAGVDNVRDPFNPTGRFDPLETASLLVVAAHLSPEQALAAVTSGPRSLMGLIGGDPEGRTDTVTLHARSLPEAIAAGPGSREVRRGSLVVARSRAETWTIA
jgi:cytosine/creatinine deaminase